MTITDPASALELLIAMLGDINPTLHREIEVRIIEALLTNAAGPDQVEERYFQAIRQLQSVFERTGTTAKVHLKPPPALQLAPPQKPAWLVAVIEGGKNNDENA